MSAATLPLIVLLRRHLRVAAVLFACVLLLKSLFAISCAAEAYAGSGTDTTPSQLQAAPYADAAACAEPDAGDCWHEGSGGCHCACAHAAPLQSCRVEPGAIAAIVTVFPSALVRNVSAPLEDALRPPIA